MKRSLAFGPSGWKIDVEIICLTVARYFAAQYTIPIIPIPLTMVKYVPKEVWIQLYRNCNQAGIFFFFFFFGEDPYTI